MGWRTSTYATPLFISGGEYDGSREYRANGEKDKETSNLPKKEITLTGRDPMEHTDPVCIFLCDDIVPEQHHREDRDADGGMDEEFQLHHFAADG